jgi:hypothetical protein
MQSGILGRRGLDCAEPVLSEVEGLHLGYSLLTHHLFSCDEPLVESEERGFATERIEGGEARRKQFRLSSRSGPRVPATLPRRTADKHLGLLCLGVLRPSVCGQHLFDDLPYLHNRG